jgi:hypothetical protein
MEAYRKIARALAAPSGEQIGSFVDFVSSAHSWYKHIPLVPPGVPFHFFLNPYVACELVTLRSKIEYRERAAQGFHYTDVLTEQYRRECGYLDYRCCPEFVPTIRDPEDVRVNRDRRISVPEEIWRAGQVNLTGLIHPLASQPTTWAYLAQRVPRFAEATWPEQMGGIATFLGLVELAKRFYELPPAEAQSYRQELEHLIIPERERQKDLMRAAVERVIQLVYL